MHNFYSEPVNLGSDALPPDRLPRRGCRLNVPFDIAYHPDSWVFERGEFVPRLKRMYHEPGVNGVKGEPGKRPDPTLMRAAMQSQGWVFIPTNEPAGDHPGYLRRFRAIGGWVYCTVWDNPGVLGSGRGAKVEWGHGFDRDGYFEWRKALCKKYGWQPSPQMLAKLVRAQQRRAHRRIHDAHDGAPHIQAHVEGELNRADAMKAAADGLHEPKPFTGTAEAVTLDA